MNQKNSSTGSNAQKTRQSTARSAHKQRKEQTSSASSTLNPANYPSDIKPPENLRQMVDKNVNLTKVLIDIFDMYTGAAVQTITGRPVEDFIDTDNKGEQKK